MPDARALAAARTRVTVRYARKPEKMGIYCVRDLNPGTGEISLNLDLNSKTGEKSP
jgi:hypothetical protein